MSLTLIGTAGLFTRLGVEIYSDNLLNQNRGSDLTTRITAINNQYLAVDQNLIDGLYSARDAFRQTGNSLGTYYQALMQGTAIQMCYDVSPLAPYTLSNAIDQINNALYSAGSGIEAPTITLTVVANTVPAANTGDAVLIASKYQGDGNQTDYVFTETIAATVTAQSPNATAGQEPLSFVGDLAVDVGQWNWPQGSGASLSSNITNANSTTLVTNGGFETWPTPTVAMATGWTIKDGAINVTIKQNTSVKLGDTTSCEFASVGGTLGIWQSQSLLASTVYAYNGWISLSGVPAAGAIKFVLTDTNYTPLTDALGVECSFTQVLTSGVPTGGSFLAINGFFRTPAVLPSVVKLLIYTSTIISSGTSLYIDRVAGVQGQQLYTGGIFAASFSGGTASKTGDGWLITVNNSKTVSSFCRSLDRNWGLRSLNKRIRTGSGISDSALIV